MATIQESVKKIIELRTKDIFKNQKQFFSLLGDLSPEYAKDLKMLKRVFDDDLLNLFVDDTKKARHRVRLIKDQLEDFGLTEDKVYFILESFGIPLGWEQEILDLKADSPMQIPSFNNQPKSQNQVNANVTDISLSEDILKQWGFQDKNSILDVLDIPSTYRSPFGTMYRVIKIDSGVFKDCTNLKAVNIPDTVTEIGNSAFEGCSSLQKVSIPDSVTKIGDRAFTNCKSLIEINISRSVAEIGNSAFGGCSSLINVTIPSKVTKISEGLFGKCKSLTNVIIPDGVTEIGDKAFAACESLVGIIIPKTVTKIGKQAFVNCKKIDIFVIPDSVKFVGLEAFGGCSKIQHFTLPTRFTVFKDDVNKQIDFKSFSFSLSSCKNVKVGDYIKFGSYPQTVDGQVQPIEWQVLSKENNKMLVISKYGLDAKRFDNSSNVWKNSKIRQWLNDYFYNNAFSEQEKKYIKSSNLSDVGTTDNIFLLSKEEAEKYFANDAARKCKITDYAFENGGWKDDDGFCFWWLRSSYGDSVYCVSYDGAIRYHGVSSNDGVVRLALYINL